PGSSTLTLPSTITNMPEPSWPGWTSTTPLVTSTSVARSSTCDNATSSRSENIAIERSDSARASSRVVMGAQPRPCLSTRSRPREAVPVRAPTFNLADLWETLVDAGPDAECLVAGPVRHTRGSLDADANRVANHLRARGIVAGEHVGIYSRNRAEYVSS